jgi:microcystin-dependent protein
MKHLCIFLFLVVLVILLSINSKNSKSRNIHEKYENKNIKFKVAHPTYEKIVSVDNSGNLGSFEFPKGMIMLWSGGVSDQEIPDGWVLCDGRRLSDNTVVPDLRGRFVLGVNPNTNKNTNLSTYELNSIGGEEQHKLTIEEIPSHLHNFCVGGGGKGINRGNRDFTKNDGGIKPYGSVGFSGTSGELNGDIITTPTGNTPIYRGSIGGYGDSNCQWDQPSTYSTGGGQKHNIMPPYYTLAYIMKL